MSENCNSLNNDFKKDSNHNIEREAKPKYNKSHIPDLQFIPPTPPVPPPAKVADSSGIQIPLLLIIFDI